MKKMKNGKCFSKIKNEKNEETAQRETTLRPRRRRRCAMGEPSLLSAIAGLTDTEIYTYIYTFQ